MQEIAISQIHSVVVFSVGCRVQEAPRASISRANSGLGLGNTWEEVGKQQQLTQ